MELATTHSRLKEQTESAIKYSQEKKHYEEQINEHARTICAMEDKLDKITNKAKEYQGEIATLRSTVDG